MTRGKRTNQLTDAALPLLMGAAAFAAAVDIGRRIYRHSQIFCPSPDPLISWDPKDYGIPEGAVEEKWIETPDGELLHGWYCRAAKPVASGLFCHGNTGNLTISAGVIPHLLDAGFNVLFFDYRGFGKSSGTPTYRGVISDGVTAARFHDRIRPKDLPSVLYGFSLGGAVAAQVIRRHPFDGLILQSTFTSLPKITRVLFPRVPLHHFAGNLFDTVSVIQRLDVPLLVIHGTDDEVIPCSMAHEILAACGHPSKQIHCVEGGLHKDLYVRDPETLIWLISQFIAELPKHPRTFFVSENPPSPDPLSRDPLYEDPLLEQWTDSALRSVRRALRKKTFQRA